MKLKKFFKRVIFFLLFVIILIVGAAFAIPYFFKDQIVELVKKEINNNVEAKVDFDNEVRLSVIRSFPYLSLNLGELKVEGTGIFEGLELAKVDNAYLMLDLMSVIKNDRPIEVNEVQLDGADIYIKVNENRTANYNIFKSSDNSQAVDFQVFLESYSASNSNFIYDDDYTNTYIEVKNFEHSGSGDLTAEIFDLVTETTAESFSLYSGGIPLVNKAKTDAEITINIDNKNFIYSFKDTDVLLNTLRLDLDGWVEAPDENVTLDVNFKAPSTDFKNLLSMIPSAYTADFKDVQATGKMALNGHIKGLYSQTTLPAFRLNLDVDNGSFQYPGLPGKAEEIDAKININSPSSNLDKMVVDVPSFHMKIGDNPFDLVLNLKNPVSDPLIKAKVKGLIDLEELSGVFPLKDVDRINGTVNADLDIDTRMSSVEKEAYEEVKMNGDLKVANMTYQAKGQPMIKVWNMDLNFSPQHVELKGFDSQLGKSDVAASGKLDNILAYFSPDLTMKGNLVIRSKLLDANEWLTALGSAAPKTTYKEEASYGSSEVFNRFAFGLDARIDQLLLNELELENLVAKGIFTPETLNLESFSAQTGDSDISAEGQFVNVFDYLFENETLGGNVNLRSQNLNMDDLYAENANSSGSSVKDKSGSSAYPVPGRVDVGVNASIKKLTYDDLVFRDMDGSIQVKDERASVTGFSAKGLGGDFQVSGFYDTKDPAAPGFDLKYKLQKLDVRQTFEKLNTVKILAPVTKFIEGALSSELNLSGKLKPDMSIDFTSLTGSGLFETFNAVLTNCTPLAKLGDRLDIPQLKKVNLEDTKNWFNLKDGMFVLEPANVKLNGLDVNVGGSHGIINQSMDYMLKFDVPKAVLEKGAVGQAAGKGLDFFGEQAGKLGLDLAQGDNIKFKVRFTGSLKDPKMKIDLLGTDKESIKEEVVNSVTEKVKEEVENKVLDEIKDKTGIEAETVEGVVEDVKEKAVDKAKELLDSTTQTAKEKALEQVKESVGDSAKAAVEELFGNKAGELLGKDSAKGLEDLKDKFKFPFGKKNKDKGGN